MNRRRFTPGRFLTIGEQLQRDRERRTFAHNLGKLIGAVILLGIIWFE